MKSDLYDDEPMEGSQPVTPPTSPDAPKEKEESDGGNTFLINREVCPDMKPGGMLTLRVNRVLDNELEVSYEKEGKDPEAKPENEMPAMASNPDGMGSMYE